jgi:tetratricopeptide (TPR) repeat protein
LEVLQEIPPAFDGKETFVDECRFLYRDKQHALKFIDEFNNKYEPQMAIWWYTREGILYTFLNQTLRQQDQHRILLCHFFIYDLSQQLKKEVDKNKDPDWRKGTVYRGQLMSAEEIEFLKKQKSLSINTFLSTTRNINTAKCYAGIGDRHRSRDSPEQSVLFEIRISEGHPANKPAADIDHLSYFNGAEGEILFCPTYPFYSLKAEYDETDSVWIIELIESRVLREVRFDLLPYLIKLDILLRTLIEKDSPSDALVTDSNATTSCLATIASEIAFLVREIKLDDNEIVTLVLNSTEVVDTNRSRFQLKALHSFSETTMPRMKSQISPIAATILYDCLATIYKSIGKYQLALENFEKATSYDNNKNHAATFNRKVRKYFLKFIIGNLTLCRAKRLDMIYPSYRVRLT